MEDDVKSRFEDVDKRYAALEKRFDDVKWNFGGVTTLFSLGFSILIVVLNWNFNAEKSALRDFQRDLKAEIGKIELPADLEIVGLNGSPLDGQEVAAELFVDEGNKEHYLRLTHFLRNRGEGSTGPLFLKLYTGDRIRLDALSSDESKFKWEAYITPENLTSKEMPGKFSVQLTHRFYLPDRQTLAPGKYPGLLKVYYGKGKVVQAKITLAVDEKSTSKR